MVINIEENKYKFIELLRRVTREGASIDRFIYKLEHSDFFIAPCSTKYHLAVKGGLCAHCLSVYQALLDLVNLYAPNKFSEESLIIAALCHDMDKMNKYEETFKNVKVYSPEGKKYDEGGRFDWVAQKSYTVKDATERFIYGHHGQNSEYITGSFIPLTIEESAAINNHMGNIFDEYKCLDISDIYNKYPLATFLHIADYTSTFYLENLSQEAE